MEALEVSTSSSCNSLLSSTKIDHSYVEYSSSVPSFLHLSSEISPSRRTRRCATSGIAFSQSSVSSLLSSSINKSSFLKANSASPIVSNTKLSTSGVSPSFSSSLSSAFYTSSSRRRLVSQTTLSSPSVHTTGNNVSSSFSLPSAHLLSASACSSSAQFDIQYEAKRLGIQLKQDPSYACFSTFYVSDRLRLSEDRLTITGGKGWGSALGSLCAASGSYYFEVTVNQSDTNWTQHQFFGYPARTLKGLKRMYSEELMNVQSSIRVGWGSRYMPFGAPCGSNLYGYALSSKNGKIYHNGILKKYENCRQLLKSDVIGCYIHIPIEDNYKNNNITYKLNKSNCKNNNNYCNSNANIHCNERKKLRSNNSVFPYIEDPRMNTKLWPWISKGYLCDVTNSTTVPPPVAMEGSYIKFSLNGYDLGIAFSNIHTAEYHPCVSAYMGGSATINFGPYFKYKPSTLCNPSTKMNGGERNIAVFNDACLMNPPRFPCKEDLVKCYVLSNEWIDELDENGDIVKRRKTYAEVEGLVTVP